MQTRLFGRVAGLLDGALSAAVDGGHRAVACGVGCGGPMTRAARRSRPSTSTNGAGSRCGVASRTAPGCPPRSTTMRRRSRSPRGGGARPRGAQLPRDGRVDGGRRRPRRRRPPAGGRLRKRGAHRPRRRRARGSSVCLWGTGLPRSAHLGPVDQSDHGPPARVGVARDDRARRASARPCAHVGDGAARRSSRHSRRVGRPRVRRAVLRRRASRARSPRRGSSTCTTRRLCPVGLGADGPLVGAAAVGLRALHLGGRPAE